MYLIHHKSVSLLRYKYILQMYLNTEIQILKSISTMLLQYPSIAVLPSPE